MSSRSKLVVVTSSTVLVLFLLLGSVVGKSANPDEAYKHLSVFTEVLGKIKSDYVEEPDIKNVTLGALNGLIESVDPFASYLNAEQYKQYVKNKDSKRADVGIILSKKFGYLGVVDVIPNSPAAKQGLNTGDMIESINGVGTRDMPLAYADLLLHGDANTKVDLAVMRVAKPDPTKITLVRATLTYPGVVSKMLPDQIAYIQLSYLDGQRVKEVEKALGNLQKQGAKRVVLDLRNAAVGVPEDGVLLANLFLEKGLITYVQGQKFARKDLSAAPASTVWKQPVVVITNRGTAGGAEVAAAALLDNKRAEVVGEKTYGDAAVRRAIGLDDGSAIILSVAKYYSPSGKSIQDNGVTPSVAVTEYEAPIESEDENGNPTPDAGATKKPAEDMLLKKAIEVVTKGNTQQAAAAAAGAR